MLGAGEAQYLGTDLELLVAAVVAATGAHVERGLEIPRVCEFDVLATEFLPLRRTVVEAKSGDTGVGDVFKFESQKPFLDAARAAMVVPDGAKAEMGVMATWGGIVSQFEQPKARLTHLRHTGRS
jgi:hypothetical protein